MNRGISSIVFACALVAFGGGCAVEQGSDAAQSDESVIVGVGQQPTGSKNGAKPGEQQVNLDLRPDDKVQGPVPDPWVGAGPVPDPWNPGDPNHPKQRASAPTGTGSDGTPSGSHP
jgi:hypothetical protein